MNHALRDIYDGFATTYDQNRGLFDITAILDAFYAELEPNGGRLLDLGCGAGEPLAHYFIAHGWHVTGVDFSARMLELAAKHTPAMQTLHADIAEVEFAAGSFEAITASYSLFHLPAEHHAALFRRLHRWLCPGGRALFTYATEAYTGSSTFSGYKAFMGQQLFYSHNSSDQLVIDLEQTGFTIEAFDYRTIGNETFLWVTVAKPHTHRRESRTTLPR